MFTPGDPAPFDLYFEAGVMRDVSADLLLSPRRLRNAYVARFGELPPAGFTLALGARELQARLAAAFRVEAQPLLTALGEALRAAEVEVQEHDSSWTASVDAERLRTELVTRWRLPAWLPPSEVLRCLHIAEFRVADGRVVFTTAARHDISRVLAMSAVVEQKETPPISQSTGS